MALDILAVGAHPDDVEIAVGGTLIKMVRKGCSVKICDLTDGEPTPLGDHDTRLNEAARSASIIGVERITLDMPNRYLEDTPESRRQLALVIRELQPNLLLAPYNGGEHPDHITASAIVDGQLTNVTAGLGKVTAWYDNEYGYSCRMKDFLVRS